MPLLEGGCAWGGASALLRVPGFLHGLSPPLAPSSYFLPFLARPKKLFWGEDACLVFSEAGAPPRGGWTQCSPAGASLSEGSRRGLQEGRELLPESNMEVLIEIQGEFVLSKRWSLLD